MRTQRSGGEKLLSLTDSDLRDDRQQLQRYRCSPASSVVIFRA
jgi:hypothetical protein